MLDEADIIRTLQKAFAPSVGVVGIGDDAAVLPLNASENYVVTKDILVENRHFRMSYGTAADLAHKALHVNLSDIAAMGAKPLYVLLGIGLPASLKKVWLEQFLNGFAKACKLQKVQLIGGDTTGSDRDLFISVTVIGRAAKSHLKFRSGAKVGDVVCVAGALGEAQAGLVALEKEKTNGMPACAGMTATIDNAILKKNRHTREGGCPMCLKAVKAKSLCPNALVAEGQWLGAQTGVKALMDVSDGLYVDLGRMLQASKVGAVVDLESLKPSAQLKKACAELGLDPRECMLTGGEDYALLFTVAADAYAPLARKFEKRFGYELTKIGAIAATKKLELREGGKAVPFAYRSFSHFGEL